MGAPIRISLVTPCFNSGAYIGHTLSSVLDQGYANLDYVVADGGSTDGSLEVIGHYRDRLSHVLSEPDKGHYDALNKGFTRTTGEVMGWLNSNDVHFPWTLLVAAEIFAGLPEVEWLTTTLPLAIDEDGRVVSGQCLPGFSGSAFRRGENMPTGSWPSTVWIQQEATFWRRSLWERAGARLEPLVACDFELWARFFTTARLYGVDVPLAGFRLHDDQRSQSLRARYHEEARNAFSLHGGRLPARATTFGRNLARRVMSGALHARLGLSESRPIVSFEAQSKRWRIVERYA